MNSLLAYNLILIIHTVILISGKYNLGEFH